MGFHLGKPLAVMIGIALVTGGIVAMRSPPRPADLTMWIFADGHARAYRSKDFGPSLIEQFEQQTGCTLDVKLINVRALDTRLLSLMMSDAKGERVPDVVELEIGSVGKYFRFPPDKVGLLPLDGFLDRTGLRAQIVAARLAPWSRSGKVFGIPHDVHPVGLTYRKDLFKAAGLDPSQCRTWDQLHELCERYQQYWSSHGHPEFFAMELPPAGPDPLLRMLLQRDINLVDSDLKTHMTNPKVLDTVMRYVEMCAGPRRIGVAASPGGNNWVIDLRNGGIGMMVTPDWRITYIRQNTGDALTGKLGFMPLPKFEETDHPTSTWGGTMLGIPRNARDPERSWKLIEFISFSNTGMESRRRSTDIISPVRTSWREGPPPQPDPLFGGQVVGEMMIQLAEQVPASFATPFSAFAGSLLTEVLRQQVDMLENGVPLEQRRNACRDDLEAADAYLRRIIEFGAFDENSTR